MKKVERIVLRGQNYVTPQTESVEIVSQGGVLTGSVANLSGYDKGTGF